MRWRLCLPVLVAAGLPVATAVALARQPPVQTPFSAQVQAYLDDWRAQAAFPGASVGIVRPDGSAFGFVTRLADRATKVPLRETDLLLAGSTGKTFFAAIAVQLVDEGKLELDAPIVRYSDRVFHVKGIEVYPQFLHALDSPR